MTDAPGNLGGLSQVARSVAVATRAALQAEWAAVALAMSDADWLMTAADTREDAPFIRMPADGLLGTWLRQEQAVFRTNDRALASLRASLWESEEWLLSTAGAHLIAPILIESALVGAVIAGPGVAGSVYPVSHLNFMKAIAEMAGPMLAAFIDIPGSQAA